MDISIFLAKYFGIYLLLISTTLLFEPLQYKAMVKGFTDNDALTGLAAIFTLMLGLFLVLIHSIIVPDWRILITALCWLVFIKGWLLFAYPKKFLRFSARFTKKQSTTNGILIGYIMVSLYLIYCGFYLNA